MARPCNIHGPAVSSFFPIQPGVPVELHLGLTTVDAKIAILWPHGDVAMAEAKLRQSDGLPDVSGYSHGGAV